MSQGISCKVPEHRSKWVVIQRNGNASAFNGYHWTPSDYSCVRCPECPRHWRTKAAYVSTLPDAPEGWERGGSPEPKPEPALGDASHPLPPAMREDFTPAFAVKGMNPKDWRKKK